MEDWLAFARGPFFRFTFAVMVLGLLRQLVITWWGILRAHSLTADRNVSWWRAFRRTLGWLVPLRHLKQRRLYSVTSVLFHVGVIVTPVLFLGHVQLVKASTGLSWWTLPASWADILSLVTLAAVFALLVGRLGSRPARAISRPQDYALPFLLAVPFLSGYLAAHPHLNPLPYNPTLLVHMLSAGVCFLVAPFSKLSHMALVPLTQLPSELAWRFPPDYPELVVTDIGREGQPI